MTAPASVPSSEAAVRAALLRTLELIAATELRAGDVIVDTSALRYGPFASGLARTVAAVHRSGEYVVADVTRDGRPSGVHNHLASTSVLVASPRPPAQHPPVPVGSRWTVTAPDSNVTRRLAGRAVVVTGDHGPSLTVPGARSVGVRGTDADGVTWAGGCTTAELAGPTTVDPRPESLP